MGTIFKATAQYQTEDCCSCGMSFAMTRDYMDRKRNDHGWFYCPAGHKQYYSDRSDKEKIEEQLRREKIEREIAEARADKAWKKAEEAILSQRASKGHLTRIKNRISKGVCPCCSRQFLNLRRHMKFQHPKYDEKEETK